MTVHGKSTQPVREYAAYHVENQRRIAVVIENINLFLEMEKRILGNIGKPLKN